MKAAVTRRWVLAVLVFTGCAVVFASLRQSRRPQGEVVLPDGRSVSVARVTFGTTHDFEDGSLLARLVARVAGTRFATRIGYRNYSQKSSVPCVIVWTRWYGDITNTPPRYASVREDSGMETEPAFPSWDSSAAASPERIMAWRFESYPRGAEEFEIRFHDRLPPYHTKPLGALRVPNPNRTNATLLAARSLPLSVATNGVTVTLRQLEVGGRMPFWRKPSHSGLAPWTLAKFEVTEGWSRSTNWIVRGISLRDASGSVAVPVPIWSQVREGLVEAGFTAAWWRSEPDWEMEVYLGRTAGFAADEMFRVIDLPAAGLDTSLVTNWTTKVFFVSEATVTLHPASFESAGGNGFVQTTSLGVAYPAPGRSARLVLLRVSDQGGREVRFNGGTDGGVGRFHAGLMLTPAVNRLNLTFGVSLTEAISFAVRPEWSGESSK